MCGSVTTSIAVEDTQHDGERGESPGCIDDGKERVHSVISNEGGGVFIRLIWLPSGLPSGFSVAPAL